MTEDKLGTMPIPKLLLTMSLPLIVSTLIQALYNIVDSIYLSWLSENAFAAISIAFPIQNMIGAVAIGTAIGVGALLSHSLGEKDYERSTKIAANAVVLLIVNVLIFFLVGFFLSDAFFHSQTQIEEISSYGSQYLKIVCCFSLGTQIQITFERILQSTGKTVYTMYTQGIGAVINIILDPILIFGFGIIPAMGVTGAAIATVIAQFTAAGFACYFNSKHNTVVLIHWRDIRTDWQIIREIYKIGIPAIIMNIVSSISLFCLNRILLKFSSAAVVVWGLIYKLQTFFFMPLIGLGNGMIPVVAYNFGAKDAGRVKQSIRFGIILGLIVAVFAMLLFQIFPAQRLGIFHPSEETLKMGVTALRIVSLGILVSAFSIPVSRSFQALQVSIYGTMLEASRQLLVLLPLAWMFAQFDQLNLVWAAQLLSEIAALIMSIFLLRKVDREIIQPMEKESRINSRDI